MLIRMSDNSLVMEHTKECTKCGVVKPLTSFSKHRLSHDGHAYQCKECNAKRAKIWRATPEGIYHNIKGRTNFYETNNREHYKPLLISKEDFVTWYKDEPKVCAYCDIPEERLNVIRTWFDRRVKRLAVDCKDNEHGYEVGNIVLACHRCNFIKLNLFTFEEMREIAQKYLKPKWMTQTARESE
jgi:Zn finger protein HypA/HybF involved in hydrogenase expression